MKVKLYVVIETIYYEKYASIDSFVDNEMLYLSWHEAVKSMCELVKARAEQSQNVKKLNIDVYEETKKAIASFNNGDDIHYFKVCELDTLDEES